MKKNYFLLSTIYFLLFTCISYKGFSQDFIPKNFTESSIFVKADTNKLFGTLTMPLGVTKCPVVLIIAGSGHTDRDGNQPPTITGDTYKQMAEKFADKGIATLRYDKRGVGESVYYMEEVSLRFDNYINDAVLWMNELKKDKRFTKLIVAGHSEGSDRKSVV